MTESVQNVEIEDVLSSIRKLVSAEPKPEKINGIEGATPGQGGPRLILTPAQRVTVPLPDAGAMAGESDEPGEDISAETFQESDAAEASNTSDFSDDDMEDGADTQSRAADADQFVETDHDGQQAGGDAEEEALSDISETWDEPEDELHAQDIHGDTAAEGTEDVHAGDENTGDEDIPEFLSRRSDAPSDDEDHIASDEAEHQFVDDAGRGAEHDDQADADLHDDMDDHAGDEIGEEAMVQPGNDTLAVLSALSRELSQAREQAKASQTGGLEDAGASSEPDTPTAPRLEILAERAANVEKALSRQPDEWEPETSEEESLGADVVEPLPWQDIEEELGEDMSQGSEAASFVDPATVDGQATEAGSANDGYAFAGVKPASSGASQSEMADLAPEDDVWFDPASVLDEDALRDMVSEIVREELQGALGERITRNVRKLVRREIHRALVAQGIE